LEKLTTKGEIIMKVKIYTIIIFASIFTIITTANAQDPGRRIADRNMESINLAMMGSGSMMGGGGMMGGQGGFNGSGWGQRDSRVPSDEYRQNRNLNNQRIHREEIQRLHERIQQKRRELSSLYRSNTADKTEINKKIDELNNLERNLDDQVSSYDNR
jgi:hypothetical protein